MSEQKIVRPSAYSATPLPKTVRSRYLRLFHLFPERALFLLNRLSDPQFVAALRMALEYVMRNGQVPDDDAANARATKLSLRAWRELRGILIEIGVGRVENGRWIDDDQQASLDIQNRLADRGMRGAAGRWGGRDA